MKLALALLIPSLIFLTPLSLFAQPSQGREALVQSAFSEMPAVVAFLVDSYDFHQKLNDEEKKQLRSIERITSAISSSQIHRQSRLPPEMEHLIPRADQLPRIEFSSDSKLFELNPGQPERSARTSEVLSDPIYFNLRYLNSATSIPSYLDILQTVFHELGHKNGKALNQIALDSLAAEMVKFLQPYYQTATLDGGVKIETLSLPIRFGESEFGPRPQTRLLVQQDGVVVSHYMIFDHVIAKFGQFTSSPAGSGNISEVTSARLVNLGGEAVNVRALSFRASFDLEIKSKIILQDPNISMRNTSVSFGDSFSQMMIPQVRTYDLAEPSSSFLKGSVQMGIPTKFNNPQGLSPELSGWDYKDLSASYRVLDVRRKFGVFRIQISNSQDIKNVFLRVQSANGELLIPGQPVAAQSQKEAQYQFSLPQSLATSTGKIRVSDVIINGQGRIPLPEILDLPVPASQRTSSMSLRQVTVFDGTSWVPYNGNNVIEVPKGPLRFRIQLDNAEDLSQIRLLWNKGSSLYYTKLENVFGTHGNLEEEIIQKFKLIERTIDQHFIYEFTSEDVLKIHLPKTAEPTIGSFDSGRRLLKELTVTTEHLQSSKLNYSDHLRIYNQEFLKVIPARRSAIQSCRKAHI